MTDFNYRALCAKLLDELEYHTDWSIAESLKAEASAACRSKPPSLAEQALTNFECISALALEEYEGCEVYSEYEKMVNVIQSALERLQELEKGNE